MSASVNHFDEPVAATYDGTSGVFSAEVVDATVDVLAELAGDPAVVGDAGPSAFELAIGTGRVAVPLAARGVRVAGVDLSEAMLRRLREKFGASGIEAVAGDMTTDGVAGSFALAYLVFNTVHNVTSQDGQVALFANAARHLLPGGRFLVETGIPMLQKVPFGERFHVFDRSEDHDGIDEYDVATQRSWSHHTTYAEDGSVRRASVPFRYTWPAELDLMARLAGLTLEHRWSGWDRSPYTSTSTAHVSVWRQDG